MTISSGVVDHAKPSDREVSTGSALARTQHRPSVNVTECVVVDYQNKAESSPIKRRFRSMRKGRDYAVAHQRSEQLSHARDRKRSFRGCSTNS